MATWNLCDPKKIKFKFKHFSSFNLFPSEFSFCTRYKLNYRAILQIKVFSYWHVSSRMWILYPALQWYKLKMYPGPSALYPCISFFKTAAILAIFSRIFLGRFVRIYVHRCAVRLWPHLHRKFCIIIIFSCSNWNAQTKHCSCDEYPEQSFQIPKKDASSLKIKHAAPLHCQR